MGFWGNELNLPFGIRDDGSYVWMPKGHINDEQDRCDGCILPSKECADELLKTFEFHTNSHRILALWVAVDGFSYVLDKIFPNHPFVNFILILPFWLFLFFRNAKRYRSTLQAKINLYGLTTFENSYKERRRWVVRLISPRQIKTVYLVAAASLLIALGKILLIGFLLSHSPSYFPWFFYVVFGLWQMTIAIRLSKMKKSIELENALPLSS